jgi:tRNA pseudouridine38-40 synthase
LSRNIKLVIAYDGAGYHGWQRQAPPFASVQETIEQAAVRVMRHPLTVHGAGRTDAGVHAAGQVGNFRTDNVSIPTDKIRLALNAKLPPDIAILSCAEAPMAFHASISACGKTYRYRIYRGAARNVMLARQVWRYERPLEPEPMRQAARGLLGTHDFRGFAFSAEDRENTVRTITGCCISEQDDELHITITGTGFLYKMVRNIVGTLVEIGRGHWRPDRVETVLATRDRQYAGPTAPACGLCLMSVQYPPRAFLSQPSTEGSPRIARIGHGLHE